MNHKIADPDDIADPETGRRSEAREEHHGDLRKGAYLKRRAEYQMQANAGSVAQAGTLVAAKPATHPGRRSG